MVVGTPDQIYGIGIDPNDQKNDKMIPVNNVNNALDIEHDDTTGFIYWVEEIVRCLYESGSTFFIKNVAC